MSSFCPYCSRLKKAFENHNYCSNAGDNIHSIKSNTFYLSANQLHSGEHISRLSIRGVLKGYQYYRVGQKDCVIQKDNYLITNEGQKWYSDIVDTEESVEILIVAFQHNFLSQAIHSLTASSKRLLDAPFSERSNPIAFLESTYPNDQAIQQIFLQLKNAIASEHQEALMYDTLHFDLLQLIFQKHQDTLKQAELIPAKNKTIQEELYRRIAIAKDYIDAHLGQKLALTEVSRVAALSPFHFLRLFKAIYQITPYQYLTQKRMKYAHYLLTTSSKTVKEISLESGYENNSAFSRTFKQTYQITPSELRNNLI